MSFGSRDTVFSNCIVVIKRAEAVSELGEIHWSSDEISTEASRKTRIALMSTTRHESAVFCESCDRRARKNLVIEIEESEKALSL